VPGRAAQLRDRVCRAVRGRADEGPPPLRLVRSSQESRSTMTMTVSRPQGASVKTGRYAILEQFVADGVSHIFGNPGTVEQGFLDALGDFPSLHYILTLQESVVIMAADGYARAAKRPAIAQIHSSPGLGNAIGAMYQAQRGHAPIVVIGGDAGLKYQAMDAPM